MDVLEERNAPITLFLFQAKQRQIKMPTVIFFKNGGWTTVGFFSDDCDYSYTYKQAAVVP